MRSILGGFGILFGILLAGAGVWLRKNPVASSVSVIGGADGPTSIFMVGKASPSGTLLLIGVGGLVVLAGIYFCIKRK